MSEIISIDGTKVKIGLDNEKVVTVPLATIAYANPVIGDEVRVYRDDELTIVRKVANKIHTSKTDTSPVVNITNTSTNTSAHAPGYAIDNTPKRVNKIVYLLLTLFVGVFGVHRFMRGQVGIGILYLLTFGLLCWAPTYRYHYWTSEIK